MSENLESFLKYVGAIVGSAVTFLVGRNALRFINDWRKGTTDRVHISRTADLSTTELQDRLYREALNTANTAVTEALAAKRALGDSEIALSQARHRLEQSEQLLRDFIEIVRETGRDVSNLERRVNQIHRTEPKVKIDDVQIFGKDVE